MSPQQIFISHGRGDRQAAEKVATLLTRIGFRTWFDQWAMVPGEEWATARARALAAADAVLTLVGTGSGETVAELRAALPPSADHLSLVPVLLPGAEDLSGALVDGVADLRDTPIDSVEGVAALVRAALGALTGARSERGTVTGPTVPPTALPTALWRVRRILGEDHPEVVRAATAIAATTGSARVLDARVLPVDHPATTAELLSRTASADGEAWAELVMRYGGLVSSVVRSFPVDDTDAADATQRTWMRLLEQNSQISAPDRLGSWLATVAARECLAMLRTSRGKAADRVVDTEDVRVNPDQQVVARDEADRIRTIVAGLPLTSRVLIQELFFAEPSSYAAVSRRTGVPIGALGPTRARLLSQLRQEYERVDPASGRRTRGDFGINAATITAIVEDASSSA